MQHVIHLVSKQNSHRIRRVFLGESPALWLSVRGGHIQEKVYWTTAKFYLGEHALLRVLEKVCNRWGLGRTCITQISLQHVSCLGEGTRNGKRYGNRCDSKSYQSLAALYLDTSETSTPPIHRNSNTLNTTPVIVVKHKINLKGQSTGKPSSYCVSMETSKRNLENCHLFLTCSHCWSHDSYYTRQYKASFPV